MRHRELFCYENLDKIEITEAQKTYVYKCLGIHDAISKEEMRRIIIASTKQFILKELPWFPVKFPYRLLRRLLKWFNIDLNIKR